jgi:DNA-directed RNA polymerase subunit M/transcription elongation factor TFIIS
MSQRKILTGEEAAAMVESFVCEACGYALLPSDACFIKSGDDVFFECPGCGDRWELRLLGCAS